MPIFGKTRTANGLGHSSGGWFAKSVRQIAHAGSKAREFGLVFRRSLDKQIQNTLKLCQFCTQP